MNWNLELENLTRLREAVEAARDELLAEIARIFPKGEMVQFSDAPCRNDVGHGQVGTVIRVEGFRIWVRNQKTGRVRMLDAEWRIAAGRLRVFEFEPDLGEVDASGGGE